MAKSIAEQIAALQARIATDTAKLSELESSQKVLASLNAITTGNRVDFIYGRKENRTTRNGQVLHVDRDDAGGVRSVKVLAGTGADTNIYHVSLSDIKAVHPVAEAAA